MKRLPLPMMLMALAALLAPATPAAARTVPPPARDGVAEVAAGRSAHATGGAAVGNGAEAEPAEPEPTVLAPYWQGLIPALFTLLIFCLLLAVLGKFAWGPINKSLKDREDRIRHDIEEAERARAEAARQQAEYKAQMAGAEQRVRELLDRAQLDGHAMAKRIRADAEAEATQLKERTTREIDAARQQAVADVRDQAATLSVAIAEKILRRNLNEDDQAALVRASLEEMPTVA